MKWTMLTKDEDKSLPGHKYVC